MAKEYNHKVKAGNCGDVFKHPILASAIVKALELNNSKIFKYNDLFTAYPESELSENGEWEKGIGRLKNYNPQVFNKHINKWFFSINFPNNHNDGNYPGSSSLVYDLLDWENQNFQMHLNDYGKLEYKSLKEKFGKDSKVIITNQKAQNISLTNSDFSFIDPPNIISGKKSTYNPIDFRKHISQVEEGKNLFVWFPLMGSPPSEKGGKVKEYSKSCGDVIDISKEEGDLIQISWGKPNSHSYGCGLFFKGDSKIFEEMKRTSRDLENIIDCPELKIF